MKQVTFKKLILQGFKSYIKPVSFTFSNSGLHIIKGLNGDGKTSLFSALTWCLYKVNLNNTVNTKIPTFKWRRDKEYIGTRVQVLFGIGKYKYLVARHIDFKGVTKGIDIGGADSLLIFKKEKIDKTPFTSVDIINDELYKSDQQAYLNKLLGIDSKTFLNSVIFGQRMSRLMDSKDAEKRDLFERLFDVDFIDVLKQKAAIKQAEINSIVQQLQHDYDVLIAKKESLEQQLENANNIAAEFKERRKVALAEIKGKYAQVKLDIETVSAQIALAENKIAKSGNKGDMLNTLMETVDKDREAYYEAKEAYNRLCRDVSTREEDILESVRKQDKMWTQLKNVKDKCPVCNSKLDEKQITGTKAVIEGNIKQEVATQHSLESGLVNLTTNKAKAKKLMDVCNETFTTSSEAYDHVLAKNITPDSRNELLALKVRSGNLLNLKEQLADSYNSEKERQAPTINISQLNSQLASAKTNSEELAKAIRIKNNYFTRLNWWQTKAFNSGGLKSFIFSASLNRLNQCVSAYAGYFGISMLFGIDLAKASKPFYCKVMLDGKNEVDYDTLSGGQKQKADLAMCFGLQDAAETIVSFNISVIDEGFEGLDIEAQEVVDTLLRIRAEKKAVYVISHSNVLDLAGACEFTISGGKTATSIIE